MLELAAAMTAIIAKMSMHVSPLLHTLNFTIGRNNMYSRGLQKQTKLIYFKEQISHNCLKEACFGAIFQKSRENTKKSHIPTSGLPVPHYLHLVRERREIMKNRESQTKNAHILVETSRGERLAVGREASSVDLALVPLEQHDRRLRNHVVIIVVVIIVIIIIVIIKLNNHHL